MNNDFINQDIQDIIIERDGYKEQVEEKDKEIDRLNNISKELVEDVFTLLRVLNRNVKELDCSNEELKIINKYSYNPKETKND